MNQLSVNPTKTITTLNRHAIESQTADVLADIYQDDINIAIWKRDLPLNIVKAT